MEQDKIKLQDRVKELESNIKKFNYIQNKCVGKAISTEYDSKQSFINEQVRNLKKRFR